MLLLIATPIGNLADMTYRAVDALQSCDYILCEDTRHSAKLLNHYNIKKPLRSLHKFNERSQEDKIIADLHNNLTIALISDAGTPGISDPGQALVARAVKEELTVSALPGPCAAIMAISCSGFSTDLFQFFGFLPRKENELKEAFLKLLVYSGTSICYESPKRIIDSLQMLSQIAPQRNLVIARELTKLHEEFLRGKPDELLQQLSKSPVKGEIVLVIEASKEEPTSFWESLTPQEHVAQIEKEFQLSRMEAIKMAAKLRGVPKREIYQSVIF
jgi:16S rRNA (cytidine1402-2'-O)-methyltransferase